MNLHHDCAAGHPAIEQGCSRAGDYVAFAGEMDRIVALSNRPPFEGQEIKAEIFDERARGASL